MMFALLPQMLAAEAETLPKLPGRSNDLLTVLVISLPVGLLLWWLLPRPGPGTKPEGSLSAKPLETGSKRR